MNDTILVRLESVKGNFIAAFYTTNWTETLKMYKYLLDISKDDNTYIPITIASNPDHPTKYDNKDFIVEDISIQFGNEEGQNSITIYVKEI